MESKHISEEFSLVLWSTCSNGVAVRLSRGSEELGGGNTVRGNKINYSENYKLLFHASCINQDRDLYRV